MIESEPSQVAVRTYSKIVKREKTKKRSGSNPTGDGERTARSRPTRAPRPYQPIDRILVFDTETTTDELQALNFGSYRLYVHTGRGYECRQEGLFYGDDLESRDPKALAALRDFVATHRSDASGRASRAFPLYSRAEFIKEVFVPLAVRARATVVGFNLPFDLSRIAVDSAPGRGKYFGGFSFTLGLYADKKTGEIKEHKYFPRVQIKRINNKASFISFSRTADRSIEHHPGFFLDLRTWAFSLTNKSYSLESACEAFQAAERKSVAKEHGRTDSDYFEYNRQDVRATFALFEKLQKEFARHPIVLDPCRAYSPASIGKAYLAAAGVIPAKSQFPNISEESKGLAMSAYFGGRAEVRIRNTVVPVLYTDCLSMYSTVNALTDLKTLFTAEFLELVDVTDDVQGLLDEVTLDGCYDPKLWKKLAVLVQVDPNYDVVPIRAKYSATSDAMNIGVNRIKGGKPLWYMAPDLVASCLLAGKAPKVLKALRLVPRGKQSTLTPVKFAGEVLIDPSEEDLFRRLIEERKALPNRFDLSALDKTRVGDFLKVVANSTGYGIYAQINTGESRKGETHDATIFGLDGAFNSHTTLPETPGQYFFPFFASLVTASARLMLALIEREITDRGGHYAFCDTDSMAIVASEVGGIIPCENGDLLTPDGKPGIRALSWAEARGIVARFEELNPYDTRVITGSILEIEKENYSLEHPKELTELYVYAISAKRYALFNLNGAGEIILRKGSQHGLGYLLDPRTKSKTKRAPTTHWTDEVWLYLIAIALGRKPSEPKWFDRPAITQMSITHPDLIDQLRELNRGRSYANQIKPMNFLLAAHVRGDRHPPGFDSKRSQLVAPSVAPDRWMTMLWTDKATGRKYHITTSDAGLADFVRVSSYRDIIAEFATHPEPKSAGPEGKECDRTTAGLLDRRTIDARSVVYIGKESNRLEDVEQGLVHSLDDVQGTYVDAETEWREVLQPFARSMPVAALCSLLNVGERQARSVRNGHARPSPRVQRTVRDAHRRGDVGEDWRD